MRVVLYTHDFEPITVIDLRPWAQEFLERERHVVLQVIPKIDPLPLLPYDAPIPDAKCVIHQVRLSAEWFTRHTTGRRHMVVFTRDEVAAMRLKSAFLPGQRHELRECERDAFAEGFLRALDLLGR